MKISTKGQYAMLIMLDLAVQYGGENVTVKSIAGRHGLSEKYLEQIMTKLSKAEYVRSIRGAKGGYQLVNPPSYYTVGMILRSIEGSLAPLNCIDNDAECCQVEECVLCGLWKKMNDALNQVIDYLSLEDLLVEHKKKSGDRI